MRAYDKGILIRTTGDIIAMSPPLIISKAEIDTLIGTLADVLEKTLPVRGYGRALRVLQGAPGRTGGLILPAASGPILPQQAAVLPQQAGVCHAICG